MRVAVVGAGRRGRDWIGHVRRATGFTVVAVADVAAQARTQAAAEHGLDPAQLFATTEEALAADPDIAIVATGPDDHVAPCLRAIGAGVAVLVEKPLATSLGDAATIVEAAERAGVRLLVAQNYRYLRVNRALRRLVAGGELGRVGMVTAHYYRVPHDLAPSLAATEHSVLWGVAVHHLDALRYVLGTEVARVAAQSFTRPWAGAPSNASLQVLLALEDGARAVYTATYQSSGHEYFEAGQESYQRLVGERATAHAIHRWVFLARPAQLPRPVRRGPRPVPEEVVLLRQLGAWIRDGIEPATTGRDNLRTIALAEACVTAAAERRWVEPGKLLDHVTKAPDRSEQ